MNIKDLLSEKQSIIYSHTDLMAQTLFCQLIHYTFDKLHLKENNNP